MLNIFSYVCWPFGYLLCRNVSPCLLPIFYWIICSLGVEFDEFFLDFGGFGRLDLHLRVSSKCVLPSCRLPFHSVNYFFGCAKAFSFFFLIQYQWFLFGFVSLASGDMSRKKLLWPRSKRLLLVLSSKILKDSFFTFRSLHILSLFLCMCKKVVRVHSSACGCPILPTPFVEETVFFHWLFFPPLSKIR